MNPNIFNQILTEFNKQNINYCVLRNYEFLLDTKQSSGSDLDITIQKQDINKAGNPTMEILLLKMFIGHY